MSYIKGKQLNVVSSAMSAELDKAYTQAAANGQLLEGNTMNADYILGTQKAIDLEKRREMAETQKHMKAITDSVVIDGIADSLLGHSVSMTRTEIEIRLAQMTFGEFESMRDTLKTSNDDQIKEAIKDKLINLHKLKGGKETQITKASLEKVIKDAIVELKLDATTRWAAVDMREDARDLVAKDALTVAKNAAAVAWAQSRLNPSSSSVPMVSSVPPQPAPAGQNPPGPVGPPTSYTGSSSSSSSSSAPTPVPTPIPVPKTRSTTTSTPHVAPTASSIKTYIGYDPLNPNTPIPMTIGNCAHYEPNARYSDNSCNDIMRQWKILYPSVDLSKFTSHWKSNTLVGDKRASLQEANAEIMQHNAQPIQVAKGISSKINFGNYFIDGKKLKNNILSVTYKNGQKVAGIRNTQISDNMKKVFTKQKLNTKKVVLSNSEKMFLHQLMKRSGATVSKSKQKLTDNMGMTNVSDMKDKLNILLGEIDAGNNSPDIVHEIKAIIEQLLYMGTITKKQAIAFMSQL